MYHRMRVKLGCGDYLITLFPLNLQVQPVSQHLHITNTTLWWLWVSSAYRSLQTNWNAAVTQMQHQCGNYELCEDKIILSLHMNNMPGQVTSVKPHILASYIVINK